MLDCCVCAAGDTAVFTGSMAGVAGIVAAAEPVVTGGGAGLAASVVTTGAAGVTAPVVTAAGAAIAGVVPAESICFKLSAFSISSD